MSKIEEIKEKKRSTSLLGKFLGIDKLDGTKSPNKEVELFKELVQGVIDAKDANDLKEVLKRHYDHRWVDPTRRMFLVGLIQGAVFQFNKKASVEELKTIFWK